MSMANSTPGASQFSDQLVPSQWYTTLNPEAHASVALFASKR